MISRAHKICSESMPSDELAAIKTIFPESGYPESVIDRVIVQMKPADGKCKSKMTDSLQKRLFCDCLGLDLSAVITDRDSAKHRHRIFECRTEGCIHICKAVLRSSKRCHSNIQTKLSSL